MISKNVIPRYEKEKQQLQELIVKMKQSDIRELDWIKNCIETYSKRVKRIDELIEQAIEWNNNPLCIVSDKLLGERHGSTF